MVLGAFSLSQGQNLALTGLFVPSSRGAISGMKSTTTFPDTFSAQVPRKPLCGGIPGSFLEPLVRYWSHFVGIYRQNLTRSIENDFEIPPRRALRGNPTAAELIPQNVFVKLFCKNQFLHRFVNLSLIIHSAFNPEP